MGEGDVVDGKAGGVEDGDLAGAGPARLLAGQDVADGGVDVAGIELLLGHRHVDFACVDRLHSVINHHERLLEDPRV